MAVNQHIWPWDHQPQEEARLRDEWLYGGHVWTPVARRNIATGVATTNTTTVAGPAGLEAFYSTNAFDVPGDFFYPEPTQAFTASCIVRATDSTNFGAFFYQCSSSGENGFGAATPGLVEIHFVSGSSGQWGFCLDFGEDVDSPTVIGGSMVVGKPTVLTARYSNNSLSFFQDGQIVASAARSTPASSNARSYKRISGTGSGSTTRYLRGGTALFAMQPRALSDAWIAENCASPSALYGAVFAPQTIWVPVSAGGGSISAAVSASAAIQAARNATASVNAAIQASQSASASVNAAVAQARTVQAALDAAVLQTRSTTAAVDAAVLQALANTASVDGVIQAAGSASSGVDAAVQAGQSATTSVNAYVQAGAGLVVSIDAYIQAGSSEVASVDAVIQQTRTGNATIDAVVSRALSASASLAAAVLEHRSATASINAYIQAGTTIGAGIEAAIQAQQSASASINAAVSLARSASVSLAAVIAVHASVGAAVDAAVLEARYGAIGVGAYIYDPTVIVIRYPSATRQIHTERQPRAIATGRINRSIQS